MGATLRISFKGLEGIKADLRYGNEGRKDWACKDLLIDPKEWIEINPAEQTVAEKSLAGKGNHRI